MGNIITPRGVSSKPGPAGGTLDFQHFDPETVYYLKRATRRAPLTQTRARQIIEAVAMAQLSRDLAAMLRELDQLNGPAPRLAPSPPEAGRRSVLLPRTSVPSASGHKPRHGSCGAAKPGALLPVLRRGVGYPCVTGPQPLRDPTRAECRFLLKRLATARRMLDTHGHIETARFVDSVGFHCQVVRCRVLLDLASVAEIILYGDRDLALHDLASLEAELRQELAR